MQFLLRPVFIKFIRWLFAGLVILVTLLSLTPNPDDLPGGMEFTRWLAALLLGDAAQSDKVGHFLAYGTLAGAGVLGFVRPFSKLFMLPVILVLYGGVMELLQSRISVRVADWADFAANSSGVFIGAGAGLCLILLAKRRRMSKGARP